MQELGEQCWQSSVHLDEAPAKGVELLQRTGVAANTPFWVCTGHLDVVLLPVCGCHGGKQCPRPYLGMAVGRVTKISLRGRLLGN